MKQINISNTCTCTEDCALGFNPACTCTCGDCDCGNIANMIGEKKATFFYTLCDYIESNYEMDKVWKRQKIKTKKWKYEYKISKGSKTLCGFYVTDNCLGFMVILGKNERTAVEEAETGFSKEFREIYTATEIFHDGKWLMFEPEDLSLLDDIKRLLTIKRKPLRRKDKEIL